MDEFHRIPNRLPPPSYQGSRSYLVTLCTQNRKNIFKAADVVNPLIALLFDQAQLHFFKVYAYCFMPDHCHLLPIAFSNSSNLSNFIRSFKGNSSALMRRSGLRALWQKGFYDHVIRNSEDFCAATAYIFENPIRAGLAKQMSDWPFSGSMVFRWTTNL